MDEPMDYDDHDLQPTKRFRHQSYHQQLKAVHLPSAFQKTQYDQDIGDNGSHFHEALNHWRQLNLSPGFIQFANQADPMSMSMPLLLHNWKEIIDLWTTAMEGSDDEGLRALLDLLQKMAHDLRTTLAPVYDDILARLLKLLARSISPEALTVLLETFNTLFRFLLVPSIHLELLQSTWSAVKKTLPKCLPEIQRAMAEVWGSVLRKLKSAAREQAVKLLAESAEGVDDASAWVIVFACKSVSQTLHTATPSIISPLLTFYLETENPEPTFSIIRRSFTALIHHVKNADQFAALGNIIVQQFKTTLKSKNQTQISRILDVTTILCSVRQGSRLTESHKATLAAELDSLELTPSVLSFGVAIFTSTEMAIWISQGVKFLQRIWAADFTFALRFNGVLAELGWGGWKLVALPLVLKGTLGTVNFSFLARLRSAKKLSSSETDLVWRMKVEKAATARLAELKDIAGAVEAGHATEVDEIFTLLSFYSASITPVIISLIEAFLDAPTTSEPAAWILSTALVALSKRPKEEWASKVDPRKWALTVLERWNAYPELLEAMVELSNELPSKSGAGNNLLAFESAYETLKSNVGSYSRVARLAALRFMTAPNLVKLESAGVSTPDDEGGVLAGSSVKEVLKRCLQGEEATLDVQGVRERVLRIGRVGQVVGDQLGAEVCARWLVAQLKVNLRPLWSPATAAVGSLSGRFGDIVWELLFSELKEVQSLETDDEDEGKGRVEHGQQTVEEVEEDGVNETERSWRDPSAHKFRVAVGHWLDDDHSKREFIKARQVSERFDHVSYEHQLLTTLGECHSLVEKHNRELVPYFLSLADPGDSLDRQGRKPLQKQKLVSWFTLFSKFQNPKALVSTQSLRTLYINSLSHPYRPLQRIALECLFTYKSPALPVSRQETLKTLLDDTRWRDELTNLDLSNLGDSEQERAEVTAVLIRLLFGLMLEKKARGKSGGGADRRAAVLGTLGGCSEGELKLLVDLMLMPLGVDSDAHHMPEGEETFELVGVQSGVNGRQILGFLTLLGDVMRLLGSRLIKYWPALLGTTLDILHFAQKKIEDEAQADVDMDAPDADEAGEEGVDEDEKEFSPKTLRSIRQIGLKRLADFFKVPVQFHFDPYLQASFGSIISPRLEAFARENIQSPSAILDLLHVWSNDHLHAFYLVKYDTQVLPALWNCLVAQNVKPIVVERIFDVIERVVGYSEIDEQARDEILKPHVELLLTNLALLVERNRGGQSKVNQPGSSLSLALTTPLGQRHLAILSSLSPFATSPSQATTLIGLFLPLLKKPSKQVPEKVKANILIILKDMMGLVPDLGRPQEALWGKMFGSLSMLYSTLRTRVARVKLVEAFARIEEVINVEQGAEDVKGWIRFVSSHLSLLNAFSMKRMDEPDFDKRLEAYSAFNDDTYTSDVLGRVPLAWSPILYQAFHDIQDVEELALRIAAGQTLRRFVEKVSEATKGMGKDEEVAEGYQGTYQGIFLTIFLPTLRSTLSTPLQAQGPNATSSFAVKSDLLGVLSFTVLNAPKVFSPTITALHPLLEEGDEEANFFNNVLHIQIHRRTRALRRLGERCEKGEFAAASNTASNAVVREWLLPIVTWFIGTGSSFMKTQTNQHKEDQSNHLATNEAIQTLGKLAGYLGWSPYYGLVQRYLKLANGNDEWEKIYVRTVVSILENFRFEVNEEEEDAQNSSEAMEVDGEKEREAEEDGGVEGESQPVDGATVKTAAPRRKANILAAVKSKLLPSLLTYLSPPAHKFKDDQTPLTVRLPVALAIARLTLRLPGTTAQERAKKQTEMRRLATELSHMMKSRSQEVRDAVRDVLGRIALTVLGLDSGKTDFAVDDFDADSYLKVLVDELQIALLRGPQLHILATTVNSIIAKVVAGMEGRAQPKTVEEEVPVEDDEEGGTPEQSTLAKRPLLLDEVVPSLTTISATILFGDVSSNPDANNGGAVPVNHVSTTFREPRQSMNASYSLYAYAAQYSSPSVLPDLLRDVKGVMSVTSNIKTMTVVDEVLRRVGGGLERNKGLEKGASQASESDWLVNVIWGLVSGNVAFLKEREDWNNPKGKGKKGGSKPKNNFVVQRSRNVNVESDQYAHNSYRFIVLGLDLLHTALRRGRFSDATSTVYKQLDALLTVLGNALYSTSTPVLLHALKCVALLVTRFPIAKLPGMKRALPVYVNQVLQIIKSSGGGGGNLGGADGELMKGALKTLGTIVRDGPKSTTSADGVVTPGVDLKEKDLTFLLELVAPDLEDPEKQGVAFALLRAIVSRRFVVPEMYDIMEEQVAPLLVQSQSNTVREQARALLLQFMLDYPQGKGRLQKTLAFLLRNASSYVHESGRTSILELLSAVLSKFQTGLITEYGEMIFVSLVMVLANDDSSKCKEASAHLISTLYGRFSEKDRKNIVRNWLRKWVRAGIETDGSLAAATGKRKLAWIALQVWGIVIEAAAKEEPDAALPWLNEVLEDVAQGLEQSERLMARRLAEEDDDMEVDGAGSSKDVIEWQLPYYALSTFGKALSTNHSNVLSEDGKKPASSSAPWSLVTGHLLFPHAWVRTAACRALGQLFSVYPLGDASVSDVQAILSSPALDSANDRSVGDLREVAAKLCEQLKSEHLDGVLGLQIVKNLLWIARVWLIQADEDIPAAIEEDAESDVEDEEAAMKTQKTLGNLPWLFSKLSYQIRGSLIRRKARNGRTPNWSQQPLAAVRWFAAMTTYMSPARLEKFLTHILSPVYRIIEEDTIQDQQLDELRTTATELREIVQQKVGGTVFSTTYNVIRQKVLEVRRERKTKRLVLGTTAPAQAAKRKEKKTLLKKESRKRKDRSFADSRGGIKRRKEQ